MRIWIFGLLSLAGCGGRVHADAPDEIPDVAATVDALPADAPADTTGGFDPETPDALTHDATTDAPLADAPPVDALKPRSATSTAAGR